MKQTSIQDLTLTVHAFLGILMQTRSNPILWTKLLQAESLDRDLEHIIQWSFSPKKFSTGTPRQVHSTNSSTVSGDSQEIHFKNTLPI